MNGGMGWDPGAGLGLDPASSRWAPLLTGALGGRVSDRRLRALARAVSHLGLARISRLGPGVLAVECGLTRSQAQRLAAMFELGRDVERAGAARGAQARTPAEAFRLLAPELRGLEVESFRVLVLDVRKRVISHEEVSRGTLDAALVHPREVFRPALRLGGAALLLAHNHPSGNPEPSAQDWRVTRRLLRAGRLLGIPVTDHLIVGGCRYISMRCLSQWPEVAAAGRGELA